MNNIILSQGDEYIDSLGKEFSQDGLSRLHVLADFDRTLTKNFVDGEEKPSLVSVLRKEGILGEEYSQKAHALYDYYHDFEISSEISLADKKNYMQEWWHKHMQLLVDTSIHKDDIEKAVELGKIEFREGIETFLDFLQQHDIPLVIISANALGADSISSFFKSQGFLTDNIHVVSNAFEWGNDDIATGYKKPVIHTFNKDETVLSNFPKITVEIKDRSNVILLGDSQGDPAMIEGFNAKNLLKVGFLNKQEDKQGNNLEQIYKELYDVVICDDGNLDFLNTFLENI